MYSYSAMFITKKCHEPLIKTFIALIYMHLILLQNLVTVFTTLVIQTSQNFTKDA